MKNLILGSFITTLMLGCSSINMPEQPEKIRFTTKVKISEYNDISSEYMYRPTFGSILIGKDHLGKDYTAYNVSADKYGSGILYVTVTYESVENYNKSIEKYFKWNEIALKDKDLITKEIMRWNYNETSPVYTKVTFHSANEKNNYFIIDSCYPGSYGEECLNLANLDFNNVKILSEELDMFKSGSLLKNKVIDDSKYN